MEKIYCISGLGADERVFQNLRFRGVRLEYLRWIEPKAGENIGHYAQRMCKQVEDPNPLLMGVSFGGMMAIEMAKYLSVRKTILISSVKSFSELPNWMKLSGQLKLNRLIPPRPWHWMSGFENYFLGALHPDEKKLANEFRQMADPAYLHWAIDQVLNWQNNWQPAPLYHLHGTKDKIFPIKKLQASYLIEGGGHFMVMNRASEISQIIEDIVGLPDGFNPL